MELSQKVCKDLDGNGQYDDNDQFVFIFSNIMENPVTNVFINSVKGQGGFASNLASYNERIIQSLETYVETVRNQTA